MSNPTDSSRNETVLSVAIFCLLVAIGVVGRWGQPDWCVTPLAATSLMAGYWFQRRSVAVAVPMLSMLISDMLLPSYGSVAVLLSVYGTLGAVALIGRSLQRPMNSKTAGLARLVSCAVSPALLFFVTTNFACWAASENYEKSFTGLATCYTAALPFFRRMLIGDLSYITLLFTAAALAGIFSLNGRSTSEAASQNVAETV